MTWYHIFQLGNISCYPLCLLITHTLKYKETLWGYRHYYCFVITIFTLVCMMINLLCHYKTIMASSKKSNRVQNSYTTETTNFINFQALSSSLSNTCIYAVTSGLWVYNTADPVAHAYQKYYNYKNCFKVAICMGNYKTLENYCM